MTREEQIKRVRVQKELIRTTEESRVLLIEFLSAVMEDFDTAARMLVEDSNTEALSFMEVRIRQIEEVVRSVKKSVQGIL